MYIIKLSQIPESGFATEEASSVKLSELGLEAPFQGGDALVSWRFQRAFEKVHGQVKVSAGIKTECARCLAETMLTVEADFAIQFQPLKQARIGRSGSKKDEKEPEEIEEQTPDDVQLVEFSGDKLPLGEEIRQELLLKIPLRPLCKPECAGLCPDCGSDLNLGSCGCNR